MHTKFDRSTSYALCAMNFLVHREERESEPSTAHQIAEACHIREGILRKTLLCLARAGLLQGIQGRGYTLSARGRSASVLDVVEAIQGRYALTASGCFVHDGPCAKGSVCAARALFQETQSFVSEKLAGLAVRALPIDLDGIPVCLHQ